MSNKEIATTYINLMIRSIEDLKPRGAWRKGVVAYALDLLEGLKETITDAPEALDNETLLFRALLNGASSWAEYSEGGCALIYNRDIAERLCNPTELKRTRNGSREPNPRESWLDVQTRALTQSGLLIRRAYRGVLGHE